MKRCSSIARATRLASELNARGLRCKEEGRYAEACAHYQRALRLLDRASAPCCQDDIATLYHNLGGIEHARGDYPAGEAFAGKGLAIRLAQPRPDLGAVAADRVALAAILDGQERHEEAEPLYRGALRVFARSPDDNALDIAVALNNLGALHTRRGRLAQSQRLLRRAAASKRRILGSRHPELAVTLNNLALTYRRAGRLAHAAALYREALDILESALGPSHAKTIACRANASLMPHCGAPQQVVGPGDSCLPR